MNPAHERAVCLAYALTGGIYLTIGLPGLLVGAFTGPHILAAATCFLAIGIASVAVSLGIPAGSRSARVAGIVIAVILTVVSLFACVATLLNARDDWPAALFWFAANAPLSAAGVTLLRFEFEQRREAREVPRTFGQVSE